MGLLRGSWSLAEGSCLRQGWKPARIALGFSYFIFFNDVLCHHVEPCLSLGTFNKIDFFPPLVAFYPSPLPRFSWTEQLTPPPQVKFGFPSPSLARPGCSQISSPAFPGCLECWWGREKLVRVSSFFKGILIF